MDFFLFLYTIQYIFTKMFMYKENNINNSIKFIMNNPKRYLHIDSTVQYSTVEYCTVQNYSLT